MLLTKIVPPGVPECVAGQNPPRNSGSDNTRAGKPPGPQMSPMTSGLRPARNWYTPGCNGLLGVPPDVYMAREVMTCLGCFPLYRDTLVVSPSRDRLPWVRIGYKETIAIDRIVMLK